MKEIILMIVIIYSSFQLGVEWEKYNTKDIKIENINLKLKQGIK